MMIGAHHLSESGLLLWRLGLLEDGLQQQGVLGEPLPGLGQDVHQPQPVTVFLRLTPLRRGHHCDGV